MNGSELLLNNAERYGLLVASSANGTREEQTPVRQSRRNIGIGNISAFAICDSDISLQS